MSTSTDSVLARAILDAADRRAGQLLDRAIQQVRYGTVTAVDVTNRKATVQLPGSATPSPGFVFFRHTVPQVGDLVRVVILPTGDRYVEDRDGQTRLQASGQGDASLSSTTHPFQIGEDTGLNIIADANEIMARNNGAISTLFLQQDGGPLFVNNLVLNNIVGMHIAQDTGDLLLTTSGGDVPGCTITQTAGANETWLVEIYGHLRYVNIPPAEVARFEMHYDGTAQVGKPEHSGFGSTLDIRTPFAYGYLLTPAAGSHTVKLRAIRTGTTSSIYADADNTIRLIRIRATA